MIASLELLAVQVAIIIFFLTYRRERWVMQTLAVQRARTLRATRLWSRSTRTDKIASIVSLDSSNSPICGFLSHSSQHSFLKHNLHHFDDLFHAPLQALAPGGRHDTGDGDSSGFTPPLRYHDGKKGVYMTRFSVSLDLEPRHAWMTSVACESQSSEGMWTEDK